MRTLLSLAVLLLLGTMPSEAQMAGGARSLVRDFALDITWPREGEQNVYVGRPFELRITPRDSLSNPVDSVLRVRLTARFPGEFDPSSRGYFEHPFEIRGTTTLLLVPNFARDFGTERQWLLAYSDGDVEVTGYSPAFSVLPHAPSPFTLTYPPRFFVFTTSKSGGWGDAVFKWERPVPADPYAGMRQRSADSTLLSDSVRYTFVLTNEHGTSVLSFPSDGDGTLPRKTFTSAQLYTIQRTQRPLWIAADYQWYVEASDGNSTTLSTPSLSEFRIRIVEGTDAPSLSHAAAFSLAPNAPNPFRIATNISFSLSGRTTVRLSILSLLGETVRLLCETELPPGNHVFPFNATGLGPGCYLARLETVSGVKMRTILLLR